MRCATCNTINAENNVYCVTCGNEVAGGSISALPTVAYTPVPPARTEILNPIPQTAAMPSYPPPVYAGNQPVSQPVKKSNAFIWIAVGLVVLAGIGAIAAFLIVMRLTQTTEVLPDHLGMFVQSPAKDRNDEIAKQDFSKVIDAKNTLSKNDSLPTVDAQPNLILYADSRDVPINDLRLIQLDTIKDDGSLKQLDFQVAPIDGKPEMRRIRVPQPIASGKYAFALLDKFFDEGNHKFWAFQVRNPTKSDKGDALNYTSVAVKPTPTPQKPDTKTITTVAPAVAPPAGATLARVKSNLKLRSSPTQFEANQIGSLKAGQTVYILSYSSNTEYYDGITSAYAFVQTTSGKQGWAFAAYLSR